MTRSDTTRLQLAKSTLIRLSDSARTIRCDSGSLWITQDGSALDIVLEPGQQFRRTGCIGTIVYALEPTHMTLEHAAAATTCKRAAVRPATRRVLAMD